MRQLCFCLTLLAASLWGAEPRTVHFPGGDGQTKLVGYLFAPSGRGPFPAVVMLHGRAGPYSSLAHGVYDATTLSHRHQEWGEFWAERGYISLLVDSFGPRGYPAGFPAGSYESRPSEMSEQTVRPRDAYGALQFLQSRHDIQPDRVGVQGWSNGGMTVLVTMGDAAPGKPLQSGFRAAIAEYPGCGMEAVKGRYRMYAPVLLAIAAEDEEVSPKRCEEFARRTQAAGTTLVPITYAGAEHNFDDPVRKKQSSPANKAAAEDVKRRAEEFVARHLRR